MIFDKPSVSDLKDIIDLLDESFTSTPRTYFEHFVPDETSFPDLAIVAKDEGKVVGFIQIFPRIVRSLSGTLRIGGVGNVAVKRDYRNRRIGSKLLTLASEIMEKRGFSASLLFASRYRFYGRHGWFIIPRVSYKFELENGGDLRKNLKIIENHVEGFEEELFELHVMFNEENPLTVVRNKYIWKLHFRYDGRRIRIAMDGERILGYVIYERFNSFFRILDTAYLFPWVLRGLLHDMNRIHFPAKPTHQVVGDLKKISRSYETDVSTDVYLKPIGITRDELLKELGIKDGKAVWHFWEMDKF